MFTVGGPIETALTNMTGWTGSLFLTLLIILIVIIVIGLALPLPMEWTALFVVPLLLVLMSYDSAFYPAGGSLLLFVAFILGKNFFFR